MNTPSEILGTPQQLIVEPASQTYAEVQASKRRRVEIWCQQCQEFHQLRKTDYPDAATERPTAVISFERKSTHEALPS